MMILLFALAGCNSTPRGLPPATALERRGEAFLDGGELAEAEAVFRQALSSRPYAFMSWVGLSRVLAAGRRFDEFDIAMQQAMAFMPGTPEGYDLVGRTLLDASMRTRGSLKLQYAATSLQFFTRARIHAPELPDLSYHAAVAHMQSGNYIQALSLLDQARVESPGLVQVVEAASGCFRALGAPANVVELLEPLEAGGSLTAPMTKDLKWARETLRAEPREKDANP